MLDDNGFWVFFWAIAAGALVAVVAVVAYYHYREALLDSQQPVVETCLKHRVSERVGILP